MIRRRKQFFFCVSLWFISIEIYNTNPSPYPTPIFYMPFSRTSKYITAKKLWPKYKQDFSWLFSSLGSHNSNVLNSLASDACDTKRNSHQLYSYQWENGFKERHERTEPIRPSSLAQNLFQTWERQVPNEKMTCQQVIQVWKMTGT